MEIAIIYEDGNVFVRFPEQKFRQLLFRYFDEYGSLNEAMDAIIRDLRKEATNR